MDGKELDKDGQVSIGPGSKIEFGSDAVFQARPTLKAKYALFPSASMFGRAHLKLNNITPSCHICFLEKVLSG